MIIKTNWNVITGAPCSGKSTLIKELSQLGFKTSSETAREVIQNIGQVNEGSSQLQLNIFNQQRVKEQNLSLSQIIFLDRAMPDTLAYLKHSEDKDIHDKIVKECSKFRYRNIFILAPVPIEEDGLRTTDPETIEAHHTILESTYRELGYTPIIIPCFETKSIEKRLEAILKESNSDEGDQPH